MVTWPLTKNTPQQNPFARHQRSVTVYDEVRMQVKIDLQQFDNYLSQVKINVKPVNKSHAQDISQFLHLSAGHCSGTQSA